MNLENLADAVTKESGQKVLAITIKDSDFSDNYNGYTYLDTMKESAVMNYLEETHDRYEKELSKESLSCMKGILQMSHTEVHFSVTFPKETRNPFLIQTNCLRHFKRNTGMI